MQTYILQGFKNNSSDVIYFPSPYNIEILSFYFDYGYLSDNGNGYAHLLEHMLIKIRQKCFEGVYENGIVFNAVTKEYVTEYTFINLRGGSYLEKNYAIIESFFKNISISEIEIDMLKKEQNTILEELSILENRLGKAMAEQMLGTKRDIENFCLKKMHEIYSRNYKNKKTVIVVEQSNIKDTFYKIPQKIKYSEKSLVIQRKGGFIRLGKSQEANILLYFLRICSIAQLEKCWSINEIYEDSYEINIKVSGKLNIENKQHIMNRYRLMCSNLKMYMEEISYLVTNNLLYLDIYGSFMENWEGCLYD